MARHAFSSAPRDRTFADINITPLVDVMLVLLIIFMVAAPTLSRPIRFDLPQANPFVKPVEPQRIHLGIQGDGTITWNGAVQPFSALQALMVVEASRDPLHPPTLVINASGDADYGVVTRVLSLARDADLDRIAFEQ
jgi:biopolymer transport protein ExbD